MRAALVAVTVAVAGCTIDARVATMGLGDAAIPDGGPGLDAGELIQFKTLPLGAKLPDDATCAALVRRTSNEPRPGNAAANQHVPTAAQLAQQVPWNDATGYDPKALQLQARISGKFTGTTDEILQWAACKWGFDEDRVRAEAAESTSWNQGVRSDWTGTTGDCPSNAATRTMNGNTECAQTYGMFQVVWKYHKSAWPMYRDSTAYHVDFVLAQRRACFEGLDVAQISRVADGETFVAGDEMACLGAHFSGVIYDDGANAYISRVESARRDRPWTKASFCSAFTGCVLPR